MLFFPVACLIFCACKKESKPKAGDSSSGNPLNAPADYLGALNKAQKSAQKTTGMVSINSAIQSFFAENNRYPKDLNELVTSGSLPQLPPAPNGMKYDYDATSGKVKLVPQ